MISSPTDIGEVHPATYGSPQQREAWFAGLTHLHSSTSTDGRSFELIASLAASSGQMQVLAVLDGDHFRAFKNLHGASASDSLLRTLIWRLSREASTHGGTLVRLGVDEFAVMVPASACDLTIVEWARSLLAKVSERFMHCGTSYGFSVSLGLALFSSHGTSAADALLCARLAVTQRKRAGGGGVTAGSASGLAEVKGRSQLARELPDAITQGQMVPYYQPMIALATGRISGMEVLARWMHPLHGMLEPAAFIALTEEQGLCTVLTSALLEQVQRDARSWPQSWKFAFNAAPNELAAVQECIEELAGREREEGSGDGAIGIGRLELEVTEGALMRDVDRSREAVSALLALGVKIVLDDFGTGYANFHQLRQIPFTRLKIDRSFVTDMLEDERAVACVRTIIELAHHLGMTATAEGVETAAVAHRLRTMGCDHAQGYFYARPMPAAGAAALVGWPGTGRLGDGLAA